MSRCLNPACAQYQVDTDETTAPPGGPVICGTCGAVCDEPNPFHTADDIDHRAGG